MKYTFLEVLEKAIGTDRRIRKTTALEDYFYIWCREDGTLINKHGTVLDWPSLKDQKAQIWEVEPEEIDVWGYRDKTGSSRITTTLSNTKSKHVAYFKGNKFNNLIPQKYKLVPVEE